MARLIDTDELWEQMKELHEKRAEEANMTGDRTVCVTWDDAILFIKNAPTVDAVEVVRCKDCMWFYDCRKDGWGRCGEHDDYGRDSGWWQATDFCAWGERKDGNT